MDKLQADKLTEIREENERLKKEVDFWRISAENQQKNNFTLLEKIETQAQALEEVRTAMEDALSVMEMEGRDFNLMPQSTIQEAVEKLEALTQV